MKSTLSLKQSGLYAQTMYVKKLMLVTKGEDMQNAKGAYVLDTVDSVAKRTGTSTMDSV